MAVGRAGRVLPQVGSLLSPTPPSQGRGKGGLGAGAVAALWASLKCSQWADGASALLQEPSLKPHGERGFPGALSPLVLHTEAPRLSVSKRHYQGLSPLSSTAKRVIGVSTRELGLYCQVLLLLFSFFGGSNLT